jgi:hypothetical protein
METLIFIFSVCAIAMIAGLVCRREAAKSRKRSSEQRQSAFLNEALQTLAERNRAIARAEDLELIPSDYAFQVEPLPLDFRAVELSR